MTPEKVLKSGPTDSILLLIGRKLSYLTFWKYLFSIFINCQLLLTVWRGLLSGLQAPAHVTGLELAPEIVKHRIVPLHSWNR